MVVFPEETKFYTQWEKNLESRGVQVRLSTEVVAVTQRSHEGVVVKIRGRREHSDRHKPGDEDHDMPIEIEVYDELVLCVLADTAKRILGKTATGLEKQILGVPTWSDDITVTHTVSSGRVTLIGLLTSFKRSGFLTFFHLTNR